MPEFRTPDGSCFQSPNDYVYVAKLLCMLYFVFGLHLRTAMILTTRTMLGIWLSKYLSISLFNYIYNPPIAQAHPLNSVKELTMILVAIMPRSYLR